MGKTLNTGNLTNAIFQDSSNNIAIGDTTASGYKFKVSGTSNLNGGMLTISGVAEYLRSIQSGTSSQAQTWYAADGTTRRAVFGFRSASSDNFTLLNERNGSLLIGTNDATNLTIASTGAATFSSSVGIGGGGTPEEVLDLYSAGADPTTVLQIRANRNAYGNVRAQLKTYAGGSSATDRFTIGFEGATNALTILGSGNVGIGTSSPAGLLHIEGNSSTDGIQFRVKNNNLSNGNKYASLFVGGTATGISAWNNSGVLESAAGTGSNLVLSNYEAGNIIFQVDNRTERMRITSGGNVGIGTTGSSSIRLVVAGQGTTSDTSSFVAADSGGNTKFEVKNNGIIYMPTYGNGTMSISGGAITTSSDMNLKNEDGFIENGLDKIMKLKPRYFYWKEETNLPSNIRQLGFYAQEVNSALGEEVANTPNNENDKWGIYDRGIIAMLTAAIQEQQAQIEELKALIAAK